MVLPQISNLAQEGDGVIVNFPLEYSTNVMRKPLRIHFWFREIHFLGKEGSVDFPFPSTRINISDDSQAQD